MFRFGGGWTAAQVSTVTRSSFQARGQELRGYRRGLVSGVHAERDVPGLRELGGEPGQPAVPGAGLRASAASSRKFPQ